ncbi:DUF2188 domain-containing protein [Virgibacillus oceani]
MRTYTVTPNVDASAWFVKLEDVAPEEIYDAKDEAIEEAKRMAEENSPALVQILDKEHNVIEEKKY